MKKHLLRRLLSVVLVVVLCMGFALPAAAAGTPGDSKVQFEQVDNSEVTAKLPGREAVQEPEEQSLYKDTDTVRVSIVLSDESTIEKVDSTENLAANSEARAYRSKLINRQAIKTNQISNAIGNRLDVVWNLTLAANIISANVEYGKIEAIEDVPGVEKVLIETRYDPAVVKQDLPVDPNMATSSAQIGSTEAWAVGYTGAGSKVAIIDTGIDTAHQSFTASGFEHGLEEQAKAKGKDAATYKAGLNLMDADKVADLWGDLNAKDFSVQASAAYLSSKIPFAVNYVDGDTDVTHLNDAQGEHGSHVAGIAAANSYIPDGDGAFSKALDAVHMQGVAPEAQLIIMKVFGKAGGAYDSDYMAAIEDAIVLGADSINLSLGSANPGFSKETGYAYQDILDSLTTRGAVVVMSAGNAGGWADNVLNEFPYLYADDVSLDTVGSPGSYTNSLAVASVDNAGVTGNYVTAGDSNIFYTESTGDSNEPMTTIAGEREYVLIDGYGTAADWAAVGEAVEGKIAICSRGGSYFYEKGNAAVEAGAIATIVYNNQPGTFGMSLSDYAHTEPCVSVTQADGLVLKANANPSAETDAEGNPLYYTGTMIVQTGISSGSISGAYTMSSFSSWGVPGSLQMKPEITAPGGNIYSVYGKTPSGGGPDQYENMSGTSMAAPQVTGMVALVAQYIREKGLADKTQLKARQLAQSLLMSTAEPLVEDYGVGEDGTDYGEGYYSVLKQGAGLANVGAAISADSYILMGADATASYADGKVKAELGDDPLKDGEYSFSFSIHNLTSEAKTYTLRADLFTQDAFSGYMDTWTLPLDADVTFSTGNTVSVPGDGDAAVTVTMKLSDQDMADLDELFPNGAYVEGYVYVTGAAAADGAVGTEHSIPVLGFYGNWSDPSMYDVGSYLENIHGKETRLPYLNNPEAVYNAFTITYAGDSSLYGFGGNPLVPDDTYMPERNAINSSSRISKIQFTPIRNAAVARYQALNKTANTALDEATIDDGVISAFFYENSGEWMNANLSLTVDFDPSAASEGDQLELSLTMAPEYYVDAAGKVAWDKLGKGATLAVPMVVDNTAPTISNVTPDDTADTLTVTASDNQYVAAAALFDRAGENVIAAVGAKQEIEAGAEAQYVLSLADAADGVYLLQVYDYAMNVSTYKVFWNVEETNTVDSVTVSPEKMKLVKGTTGKATALVMPDTVSDDSVRWSSSDDTIAAVDEKGIVTAIADGTATITATSKLDPSKTDSCTVEVFSVNVTLFGALQDEDGNPELFSWDMGSEETWTPYADLEVSDIASIALDMFGDPMAKYDFNDDAAVDEKDATAILELAAGKIEALASNAENADLSGDGAITSYDAYLLLQLLQAPETPALYVQDSSSYMNRTNSFTGELCEKSALGAAFGGSVFDMDFAYLHYMATEKAEMVGVWGGWLLFSADPMTNDFSSGYNLTEDLAAAGANKFVAITWGGTYNHSKAGPCDVFYALDDSGCIWNFLYPLSGGLYLGSFETGLSDLDLNYPPYGDQQNCSLVMDQENAAILYLSYFTGATNELYMIDLEDGSAKLIGEFGDGIWPAALFLAASNAEEGASVESYAMTKETLRSAAIDAERFESLKLGEIKLEKESFAEKAAAASAKSNTNAASKPSAPVKPLSEAVVAESEGTVVLDVTAKDAEGKDTDSNNGKMTVKYDSAIFELVDATMPMECQAINTATAGEVVLAYATLDTIAAGESVATITLKRIADGVSTITVTHNEVGQTSASTEEPIEIDDHSQTELRGYVAPTPTQPGYTGDLVCAKCGKVVKAGSVIPATGVIVPMQPIQGSVNELPFEDVSKSDSFYDDVRYVYEKDLMNGTSKGRFSPTSTLTRAMVVTILYRMENEPTTLYAGTFPDVADDQWYTEGVEWAVKCDIVNGYSNGKFGPEDPVTREQLVAILYRYAQYKGYKVTKSAVLDSYADSAKISAYAVPAMKWAEAMGILDAIDGKLLPRDNANRAQVASAIASFHRTYVD